MMTYCARIVAIGLFVADGLADRTLITFDSNGPKDCSTIPCRWNPHSAKSTC